MFEKLEKYQIIVLSVILALGLILATKIATSSLSKDAVSVTGSAYEIVTSDSGHLDFDINAREVNKIVAYNVVKTQLPEVIEYLKSKGIEENDIEIKAVNGYYNYKYDPKTGTNTNQVLSYNINQPVSINSKDVQKIKDISTDIQSLLDKGIDINVSQPAYFYSKLSDLKVRLLQAATDDAKQRASAMLKATNNKVGKIQSVKMGVFQITEVDSTNVSDMGINDTSTIEKKVTAVANVTFSIK